MWKIQGFFNKILEKNIFFSQNWAFLSKFSQKLAKYANRYANKEFWLNMHKTSKMGNMQKEFICIFCPTLIIINKLFNLCMY